MRRRHGASAVLTWAVTFANPTPGSAGLGNAVFAERRAASPAPSQSRTPAVHEYGALAFYTGGRALVEQRGRWELGPGDVLLVPAGEPIEAVAERVGYAGATHFVRMFRLEHGLTPAAWRAARRV